MAEPKPAGKLSVRDKRLLDNWLSVVPCLFSTGEASPSAENKIDVPKAGLQGEFPPSVEKEHQRCVSLINKLFDRSPIIRFMDKEMKKLGCSPPVFCTPCSARVHGGFSVLHGIAICENHIPSKRRAESTLAHEMVHAYDHCRFKFDLQNLKHVACSEVNARRNVTHVGPRRSLISRMPVFG
jgi:hypothetical protein